MKRYWAIAPCRSSRKFFDDVWQWNLENGHIALGWGLDQDPSKLDHESLQVEVEEYHSDRSPKSREAILRMIWNWYHEVKKGDIVVARRGLSHVLAVGTVKRKGYFDPQQAEEMPAEYHFENFLDIEWHDDKRNIAMPRRIFAQPSIQPMSEDTFVAFIGTVTNDTGIDQEEENHFSEGKEAYRQHIIRERNQRVVKLAKDLRKKQDPLLRCDACGFSFAEEYGDVGEGFCEAHHTIPYSEKKGVREVRVEDFALVCSNCHRMLHRKRPWLRLKDIKRLVAKGKNENRRIR